MTKSAQLKMGRVWGLALAVSFLVAASVQADVLRTASTSDFLGDGYELVKIFTFTYDGTAVPSGVAATWNIAYGDGFDGLTGFGYDQTTSTLRGGGVQSLLTSWFDSSVYDRYVGEWSDDASVLTVNGAGVGGTGNWFYNLLFNAGPTQDELTVNFGQKLIYTFSLYAVQPVTTPEPATMALVGLGIAGLGLARRRMKK